MFNRSWVIALDRLPVQVGAGYLVLHIQVFFTLAALLVHLLACIVQIAGILGLFLIFFIIGPGILFRLFLLVCHRLSF